jgi:hypothetical protein
MDTTCLNILKQLDQYTIFSARESNLIDPARNQKIFPNTEVLQVFAQALKI